MKEIRRELGISNADIAKMFGYASKNSYEKSSAKMRIEKGIKEIYRLTIEKNK